MYGGPALVVEPILQPDMLHGFDRCLGFQDVQMACSSRAKGGQEEVGP